MEIKGSAVKTTPEFVKSKYSSRYLEWVKSLPDTSREIIDKPIYATTWYPLMESVIIPTQRVADMFFNGNYCKAAREIGRYSAEVALKGIYKIFVRVSSPNFVLSRASNIFSTYYNPADIKVIESADKKAVLQLKRFNPQEKLIMERIAGWIEHTLEITLKSPLKVDVSNKIENDMLSAQITAMWE